MSSDFHWTRETWLFINTFAPWFAAGGTFAAVVVSLYLARASQRVRLRVTAGLRLVLGLGQQQKPTEHLYINVVNVGSRVARVTNLGWCVGLLRRRQAVQIIDRNAMSSQLPIELADGQEATWIIPLVPEENWIDSFSQDLLLPYWRSRLWSAKLQVFTSLGRVFEAPLERSLKRRLTESCRKQRAAGQRDA